MIKYEFDKLENEYIKTSMSLEEDSFPKKPLILVGQKSL